MTNKYYEILGRILATGKTQTNKKGGIRYLLNQQLSLSPADLLDIFEGIPSPGRNSGRSSSCSPPESASRKGTGRPAYRGGITAALSS